MEAAGALKEGNLGLEEGGGLGGGAVVAVATQTKREQKLKDRISFQQENV